MTIKLLPADCIALLQHEFNLSDQTQVAAFLGLSQGRISQIKKAPNLTKKTFRSLIMGAYQAGKKEEKENIRRRDNSIILEAFKSMHGAISHNALADILGVKPNLISQWKNGYAPIPLATIQKILKNAAPLKITAIAEMEEVYPSKPGGKWYFFHERKNAKRQAFIKRLADRRGIYCYLDSWGRINYVGKADKTSLDKEVENRLSQETKKGRIAYGEKLKKSPELLQGDVTKYVSVYEVSPPEAIPLIEALLIRSNCNTLYNKKLENFIPKPSKKTKAKKAKSARKSSRKAKPRKKVSKRKTK